jgi:hypothetical protein
MSRLRVFWPVLFILIFLVGLYWEIFFKGYVAAPIDILTGAYFPWLDYKWGFSTGVPVKNPIMSDVFSVLFIYKHLSWDIFRQGILPFWNDYILAGTPLLAAYQSAVLFPANIFFSLPRFWGWNWFIISSTLAAALSAYAYLSFHLKSKVCCLFGSIIFSLSSLMTTWTEFGTAVWAMSTIPLIFLSLDQILICRKKLYLPVLSSLVVLLVLAGNLQVVIYALILAFVYSVWRNNLFKDTRQFRLILLSWIAVLIGLSLTMIQLGPSWEFSLRSIRAEEKYSQSFNYGLTDYYQLIQFWNADFFGHPVTNNFWGKYFYGEYSYYLGVLVLPLIIYAIWAFRGNRYINFFLTIFIVSLFLSVNNPISRLIFSLQLPLLTYSSASRILFVTLFSASIIASFSLEHLISKRKSFWPFSIACFVLIMLTFIAFKFVPSQFLLVSFRNSIIPIFILTVAGVINFLPINRKYIAIVLLLLLCFDLGRYFRKYNPFIPARIVYPETPITKFLSEQPGPYRIIRQKPTLLPPNSWSFYKIPSIEGYDPLQSLSYNRFFHVLENRSYFDQPNRIVEISNFNPAFLNALNVKYILTLPKSSASLFSETIASQSYPTVFTDGSVEILENPSALARAFFISSLKNISGEKQLADTISQPDFDPQTTAVVSSGDDKLPSNFSLGILKSISYNPNKVTIHVSSKGDSFLVLSDSYDPGWKAEIDGRQTKVYQTDGALRGVRVNEGDHTIIYRYLPRWFEIFSVITIFTFVFSCGYLFKTRFFSSRTGY